MYEFASLLFALLIAAALAVVAWHFAGHVPAGFTL